MRLEGGVYIQYSRQAVDNAHDLPGRAPRLHDRFGHHHANHLPDMLHGVLGKDRLVACKRSQHVVAWHIPRQHHIDHTGQAQRCRTVHVDQPAVRYLGQDGRGIQRALELGDIVNIRRSACDLGPGAFMKAGLASSAWRDHRWRAMAARLRRCRAHVCMGTGCSNVRHHVSDSVKVAPSIAADRHILGSVHGVASSLKVCRLMCCTPWLSSQKRHKRLPSTCTR